MSSPREAQLPLLLSISEGLSRGTDEMLRVSPQGDAMHPPSCSLAIREAVEEIKWLRAEVERQARHVEELREKIDAERSCACSFDAPGDVCGAHSPALMRARAEVERLTRERDEARSKETDYREGFQEGWDAAHEGTAAVVKKLREALKEWDALIVHQFHGTRDAMSDMQRAALNTKRILDELDAREALEAQP